MYLSTLVFQVVKNVKYLEDTGFNLNTFRLGEYAEDQDYANSINNAFTPINEAIHRLSDRNKLAFVNAYLGRRTGVIDLVENNETIANHPIKKIKSIYSIEFGDYKTCAYREMGKNKVLILSNDRKPLYVQYIEDIKHFDSNDYAYHAEGAEVIEDRDVDLQEYGINENMISYIVEYAQGKLQEPIAPELANMHLTRAEQYFEDLDDQQTPFYQKNVSRKYSI